MYFPERLLSRQVCNSKLGLQKWPVYSVLVPFFLSWFSVAGGSHRHLDVCGIVLGIVIRKTVFDTVFAKRVCSEVRASVSIISNSSLCKLSAIVLDWPGALATKMHQ